MQPPTTDQPQTGLLSDLGRAGRSAASTAFRPINWLFHQLRKPQQALAIGPALAATKAAKEGRGPTLKEVFAGSQEALSEDLSFRHVMEKGGVTGKKGMAAGLIADIALDPLWILSPLKAAKLLRLPALLKASRLPEVGQKIAQTPAGQAVGRALVPDFGKPSRFIEIAEEHHREVSNAVESAVDLGRRIGKFEPQAQRRVRDFMITGSDAGRQKVLRNAKQSGFDPAAIEKIAVEAMERDIKLGGAMVDTGLMTTDTFLKWRGQHMWRAFRKHQDPVQYYINKGMSAPKAALEAEKKLKAMSEMTGPTSSITERLAFLTERQDLPPEMLRQMGEILEAAYPVAKGQAMAGQAVATRRMLNTIKDEFSDDVVGGVAPRGFKIVPNEKGYGPLAGRAVPESIHRDVVQLAQKPGRFGRLWRQNVGWWKYGKVVLNPATHARNVMSNFVLADLAGLAPFKVHRYVQGARSLATKDKYYQEAKQAGTFLTDTFVGVEIPKLMDRAEDLADLQSGAASFLAATTRKAKRAFAKAGDAYQAEEQWFKMSFFIDQRKRGIGVKEAANAAEDALFNYRRVPWLVDNLRRYGAVPFITFPYKALPATAKALAKRPAAISRYGHIIRTFEAPKREQEGERSALPTYMQDGWMRLPGQDQKGRVRYLNLEYVLPWGDLGEAFSLKGYLGTGGRKSAFLSVPGADLAAALVTGDDPFTNQKIADRPGGMPRYLYNFVVPPLAGYAGQELAAAAQGVPVNKMSSRAEPRSKTQAVLSSFFGVKITPVDIDEERGYRIRDLSYDAQEIRSTLRRTVRSPYITEEEKEAALTESAERIRELVAQMVEIRDGARPDAPARAESASPARREPYRLPRPWETQPQTTAPPAGSSLPRRPPTTGAAPGQGTLAGRPQ